MTKTIPKLRCCKTGKNGFVIEGNLRTDDSFEYQERLRYTLKVAARDEAARLGRKIIEMGSFKMPGDDPDVYTMAVSVKLL